MTIRNDFSTFKRTRNFTWTVDPATHNFKTEDINSHDLYQLCYLYGVSVMCMNFSELTCAVYEHFRTSTM